MRFVIYFMFSQSTDDARILCIHSWPFGTVWTEAKTWLMVPFCQHSVSKHFLKMSLPPPTTTHTHTREWWKHRQGEGRKFPRKCVWEDGTWKKKNIENLKNHFLIVGHFAKGKFSTFSKWNDPIWDTRTEVLFRGNPPICETFHEKCRLNLDRKLNYNSKTSL